MKTGSGTGERGPWGWGSELGAFFDPAKIHVYNEGRGGRSSRGYMRGGRLEAGPLEQVATGRLRDHPVRPQRQRELRQSIPDRTTINAAGDEQVQIGLDKKKVIHTYGAGTSASTLARTARPRARP